MLLKSERMRMKTLLTAMLLLLCVVPAIAQRRRGGAAPQSKPLPIKGVIVSVHGTVQELTKKSILVQTDENQLVTVRIDKKTKFLKGTDEIKATDIDLNTVVTVDAAEDAEIKLLAVDVKMDPKQKAPELPTRDPNHFF